MEINFENKEGHFYIVTYDAKDPNAISKEINENFECVRILDSVFIVKSKSNIEIEKIIKPLIINSESNDTKSDYGYIIELLEKKFLFGFIDKSKQEIMTKIHSIKNALYNFLEHDYK